jgi:hypothetical protein
VETMAKFICLTQVQNLATFPAPSGICYDSIKGTAFNVNENIDVEHFEKNSRFKKLGLVDKIIKPKVEVQNDNDLKDFLNGVKGLTKFSIDKILNVYDTKEQVIDDIETDKKRFTITPKQKEILINELGLEE